MKPADDYTVDEALAFLRSDSPGARAWTRAFTILLAEGLDYSVRTECGSDEDMVTDLRAAYARRDHP